MKLYSDMHTHTTFCDGANTVEEMVQEAIRRNFVSLGFSIHGWHPWEVVPVTLEKEAAYREEVKRVREIYKDRIEILLGAERDSIYERDFSGYEYLIDSCHWFTDAGEYFCADYSEERMLEQVKHFDGDYYAYCRSYFRQAAAMCAKSDAAFIGHIDLITKFNEGSKYFDEGDSRFLNPAKEAAIVAIERRIPLEMNTGAIGRGYRTKPYPCQPILDFIRKEGGEIIINGDSHSVSMLETGYDIALEMARHAGFDHVLRMRKGGFEEVGII